MNKAGMKRRDLHFYSNKNGGMVCVHSEAARAYAQFLEEDEAVESYEAGRTLDMERYCYVDPVDIRSYVLTTAWETDFVIRYRDGRTGIREIVTEEMLNKRANIEKLEFSRRYWSASAADEWKIAVMEKGGEPYVLSE